MPVAAIAMIETPAYSMNGTAASNPKPNQTAAPAQLDFHIAFLNKIPILWTVVVVITLIGAIYYLIAGRRKDVTPITTPPGDDPVEQTAGGAEAAA